MSREDYRLSGYDNLKVSHPELIYDLPAGMPRLR